jgi:GNAT superfamily N-acetyltransferase
LSEPPQDQGADPMMQPSPTQHDRLLLLIDSWSDVRPSWQNASDSVRRSAGSRTTFVAEMDGEEVGAIVVYATGDVPLLAVAPAWRGRGLGTSLLRAAHAYAGKPLRFINVDAAAAEAIRFLERHGARELVVQHEMVLRTGE